MSTAPRRDDGRATPIGLLLLEREISDELDRAFLPEETPASAVRDAKNDVTDAQRARLFLSDEDW